MVLWKRLSRENVLPFYGVDTTNFQLALVYDWTNSGNTIQYSDSHPKAFRTCLVPSLSLNSKLHEVARGLMHFYSFGVVHGDPKWVSLHCYPLALAFDIRRINENSDFPWKQWVFSLCLLQSDLKTLSSSSRWMRALQNEFTWNEPIFLLDYLTCLQTNPSPAGGMKAYKGGPLRPPRPLRILSPSHPLP